MTRSERRHPESDAAADSRPGDGAATDAGAPREDLGESGGSDVITIGDSRMRNFGVQGAMLLDSNQFGAAIPTQYDDAKCRDPISRP